mmetsp:Transcript_33615/g.99801  ORF Transcript_33615/g.99801 Transcript_33615/m.99801 type:complete len:102 (-) Transcript_33615:201-506(-)
MGIPLKDPIDYADEPASKIPDWFTWIITLFVAYVVVMSTLLPMWQNFKGAVTGKVRGARTLLLGQCNAGKTTGRLRRSPSQISSGPPPRTPARASPPWAYR